jgi:hypothetical protein
MGSEIIKQKKEETKTQVTNLKNSKKKEDSKKLE